MLYTRIKNSIVRYRDQLAVLFFIAVASMLVLRTFSLLNVPDAPNPDQWALRDFRDAIYYPVVSWINGNNPYDAKAHMEQYPVGQLFPMYSPLTLAIHLPFGLASYRVSEFLYVAYSLAMSLCLAGLALHMAGTQIRIWRIFLFAGLILLSRPGHMCQLLGQTAFTATILTWLAVYFANRKFDIRSGLCVALASFKPTFGLILLPLIFAKGHYKAAIIGSVIMVLSTGTMAYTIYCSMPENSSVEQVLESNRAEFLAHEGVNCFSTFSRDDVFPLLSRVAGTELPTKLEFGLSALMIAISAIAIKVRNRNRKDRCSDGLTTALICVTLVVCIYHHTYDTIVLALPWLAILVGRHPDWRNLKPVVRWVLLITLTIPAINFLSTNTVISGMNANSALRNIITSINGVALLTSWSLLTSLCLFNSKFRIRNQSRINTPSQESLDPHDQLQPSHG